MFRRRYIKSLIMAAAAAVAAACTSDPVDTGSTEPLDDAAPASLTIDFSVADLGIDVPTRVQTVSGTEYTLGEKLDPDHPERMDEAAAYVNGSMMDCLVVLLVHEMSNRIVGIRELPGAGCTSTPVVDKLANGFIGADGEVDPDLTCGSRARITFNYENPLHIKDGKSVERLLRGNYRLFAIANFKHLIPTSQAESQANQPSAGYETVNLHKALNEIISDFHENSDVGLGNFSTAYEYFFNLRFLMNCTLSEIEGTEGYEVVPMRNADGDQLLPYIRPAVMQTLSAVQSVPLRAGQNKISVEMLRISSRTRVEVKNTGTTPLKVHSLEFSPNYTQCTNYLFRRERNEDNYVELRGKYESVGGTPGDGAVTGYPSFTGAPLVSFDGITESGGETTAGAIVPFANNMDLDNDGVLECGVPAGEKSCIFDALMYESRDAINPFTYTIDVSYPGVTDYRTNDIDKIDGDAAYTTAMNGSSEYAIDGSGNRPQYLTGFTDVAGLLEKVGEYPSGDGCYFLIQSLNGRYLQVNANGELRASRRINLASNDLMSYLWKVKIYYRPGINGNGSYVCELRNAKSGKYIPYVPPGTTIGAMAEDPCQHMPAVYDQSAVSFATRYVDGSYYYLNVWNNSDNLGGYGSVDNNSKFRLYPVKSSLTFVGTPRMKKTVTLATFSDDTAVVEQVREIQRNDFIRIFVEVSYNPDSSEFLFEVNSWNEKDGAVEFN